MDPLSIAAAIAGFLSLAGQIATTLKDYVDGVQSAPVEVQTLYKEVTALRQVLESFVGFLKNDDLRGRNLDSSCVLFSAVQACKYQLEELRGKLTELSEACSNKKLPGWVTRMKWPLKKDEVQHTIVALQRFANIFQFSMTIKNYELVSQNSSAVILQLDENRQEMEKIASALQGISMAIPDNLQTEMTKISEIKALVTDLSQFSFKEVHNISLGIGDVQKTLQDIEIGQIMPLISPLEPHKRHQDIRQNRLEGTGSWFLLEPAFQKWSEVESQDTKANSVLVCSGMPGAGKSVICSFVFDHLEKQYLSDEKACVACVYCDYQSEDSFTPVNMIGVLLKQVICKLSESKLLHADIISSLKGHLRQQKSIGLEEGCRLMVESVKQLRKFYICIDALDECTARHRAEFIEALSKISGEVGQGRKQNGIRIFFTTRPHINWEELMTRNPGIGSVDHICLKAHPEDIRTYISHEIDVDDDSDCMDKELRNEILDTIVANSDGMFLLAEMQIQTVLDETTISTRSDALRNMPTKLETAFDSTMKRINNQKPQRSKKAMDVLKWTFLARRPLTITELRHALSVTIAPTNMQTGKLSVSYDKTVDWRNFPSQKSLIDWCLGLVVIDEETSTVRLVHKSLHDHLTELHDSGEIFPDGHTEIAHTCLQYMCFNDDQPQIDSSELEIPWYITIERRFRFCLLDYAIQNFGHHLRDQNDCTADMINAFFPDSIDRNRISTALRSKFSSPFNYKNRHSEKYEYILESQMHLRLQFAISCGLENAFRCLLDASGPTIDCNARLGGSTMLLQASKVGKSEIVRILLDKGVSVNLMDSMGQSALSWASRKGHDSVVKLLLQADGININSKDKIDRTALICASQYGHDSVVKLLLQADGIDINSQDDDGRTALIWASDEGHDSVVELLLQADGIDINSKDHYGRTALICASEFGHDSVVKLLLQADGIDINSKDHYGRSALICASEFGHDSVVKLLLQADGIDINSQDDDGRTALIWASDEGHD
ncbi:hypothetical protein BZA77DRAFT_55411 [Pyronema omphalodes]|nr:hypothetical protein BZA77DRAFT_55411 [Pyronema omphalodes]